LEIPDGFAIGGQMQLGLAMIALVAATDPA
jgi:hypothetical protein